MSLLLDHVLFGAPDLGVACDTVATLVGVVPDGGGSHPGFGTRNRLLSLGEELFFEVIAPDPAQAATGRRAEDLEQLSGPKMLTFCVQSSDLGKVAEQAKAAGFAPQEPVAMTRTRPDGVRLDWEILYLDDVHWGAAIPFVIDWKGAPHPGSSAPGGCSLVEFVALHPRAAELAELYKMLGVPVTVIAAQEPGFLLRLDTPRGSVILQ